MEEIENPKKKPSYRDEHTADNAINEQVPPVSAVIGDQSPEARLEEGSLSVFIGNRKADKEFRASLVRNWVNVNNARAEMKESRNDETISYYNRAMEEWDAFVSQTFPDKTPEEVEVMATAAWSFATTLFDEVKVRSDVLNEPGITNRLNRGSLSDDKDLITGDIVPKVPSDKFKVQNVSDRMRRAGNSSRKDPLNFDVLLRDSCVRLTIQKPSRLAMGTIINSISSTISGYVDRTSYNFAVVARVAAYRAIWEEVSKTIVSSSITGISDFKELIKVIRLKDMEVITMAYLSSFTNKGVPMALYCHNSKERCDWHEYKYVNPNELVMHREEILTPEYRALFANLLNGTVTHTIEEANELASKQTFGVDAVIKDSTGRIALHLANPTLEEAFASLDALSDEVSRAIADLRKTNVAESEYEKELAVYLANLGAVEYYHWVSKFECLPEPGSDESSEVIKRADSPAIDFNKGLMDTLLDDITLNSKLKLAVLNTAPRLTNTIIGISSRECPKCGKDHSESISETIRESDPQYRSPGYTPIEPVTTFFTLTRLMMLGGMVYLSKDDQDLVSPTATS